MKQQQYYALVILITPFITQSMEKDRQVHSASPKRKAFAFVNQKSKYSNSLSADYSCNTGTVKHMKFAKDGQVLVIVNQEKKKIQIWSAKTGEYLREFTKYNDKVDEIALNSFGDMLLACYTDTALLWNLTTGKVHEEPFTLDKRNIELIAFSDDGKSIIITYDDEEDDHTMTSIAIKKEPITALTMREIKDAIKNIPVKNSNQFFSVISPDRTRGAELYFSGLIKIFDIKTGNLINQFNINKNWNHIFPIRFSPDNNTIAAVTSEENDNEISLWDIATGQCNTTLCGHTKAINDIAFSPNGIIFATASDDKTARIWNLKTRTCLKILPCHSEVIKVELSKNKIATAHTNQTVKLWNTFQQPL